MVLHQPDILDALLYVAGENELPAKDIPVPASGVGYLRYEFCARCDTISLAPPEESKPCRTLTDLAQSERECKENVSAAGAAYKKNHSDGRRKESRL